MPGVLVITGASRGIGAATALLTAAVVADILGHGGEAIAAQADVSRAAEIERLFTTVDKRLGPLTALVNNVGVLYQQSRVDQLDEDRLHRVLRVIVKVVSW
jgi:NAD(P)-dependent dehydrogenase (short-subunit alcohol dehydrogenase family)